MKTTLQQISYGGWVKCLQLSDGKTELVVTTNVGPRIIRCAVAGGTNLLKEFTDQLGRTGGKSWTIYGGHRFWVAPEDRTLTYAPDNEPVPWSWSGRVLRLVQHPDRVAGLQKVLEISMANGTVTLCHTLVNRSRKSRRVAPWSLTVMAPGGCAVVPQEAYGSHERNLRPVRPLVLWKYTNMDDPRWRWGRKFVLLKQDRKATRPQKAGFLSTPAWMAYLLPHATLVKRHGYQPGATYPDMGCNAELFTNHEMLELESVAPLVDLKPGAHIRHVETWRVFPTGIRDRSEANLTRELLPLVAKTRPAV